MCFQLLKTNIGVLWATTTCYHTFMWWYNNNLFVTSDFTLSMTVQKSGFEMMGHDWVAPHDIPKRANMAKWAEQKSAMRTQIATHKKVSVFTKNKFGWNWLNQKGGIQ